MGYEKYDDAEEFLAALDDAMLTVNADGNVTEADVEKAEAVNGVSFNKDYDDLSELYVIDYTKASSDALKAETFKLVNTSGKVVEKSKSKDGNDYVYVTDKDGVVRIIYVED